MTPIVVCSVTQKSLPVLQASVAAYNPDVPLIVHVVERSTFGASYNMAMAKAFEEHDEIIIANDDIVLNPHSYRLLLEDVENLKSLHGNRLGVVAARSDCVRPHQLITNGLPEGPFPELYISPLLAWVSKEAFAHARFPLTNWFSDDLFCMDLTMHGFTHYVSRAYVHHAGSQTIGNNEREMYLAAIDWIAEYRPERLQWFKR